MKNKSLIRNYNLGVIFFILCLFIGVLNDIVVKIVYLPSQEIVFFKYLFGTIILLPLMNYYKISLKSKYFVLHIARGFIIYLAFSLWVKGLKTTPIATATMINFMGPIFLLLLNNYFLNEKIIWQKLLGTIIGFIGITIAVQENTSPLFTENSQNIIILAKNFLIGNHIVLLFLATFFFAILDIINKKYLTKEPMIITLFYSSIFVTLFAIPETIH